MADTENLGSFFRENKKLVKDYLDTRLAIYRLRGIRLLSRMAGYFIWIIISLFLVLLLFTFGGLVTGFWLSSLTGSYVMGFGITTILIAVVIVILALLRKQLFVNPIIRAMISQASDETEPEEV